MSDQLTFDLDADRDNDSPLIGTAKNEKTLMAFNFFSLTREHQTELPRYDDGKYTIEVEGTKHGVASIWDKEVLIYLESLLQDRINRGEAPSPIFQFTANDLFRITGSHPGGSAYERLEGALKRLKGTMVTTNLLDDDDEGGETGGFSWIDDYRIKWRKNKNGEKSMQAVSVILGRRLYKAILKRQQILTYDSRYFQLKPLEKRLYEIARAHVGKQPGFKMGLEKLRLRVGTQNDLRRFKAELVSQQAQVPAPRLRPEPDRSAYPALHRRQEAEADRTDAIEIVLGVFLSDRPAEPAVAGRESPDAGGAGG
jgi:plasmid replication initiation protein